MNLVKTTAIAATLAASMAVNAADFTVDASHSTVQFAANHMGFSKLIGHFNEFEGSFTFDEANPSASSANLVVNIESVDTNHEKRDAHLKSPDFFDAKQFPQMTFKSNGYTGGADKGQLSGDLTILGVSVPTTFDMEKVGFGPDPWGGTRIGFVATTVVDRTDFGMNYSVPGIPAEVEVSLFIEGIMKK